MGGASLLAVSKVLGHVDVRLVVRCYAHLSPEFLADTIRNHFPKFTEAPAGKSELWRQTDAVLDSTSGQPTFRPARPNLFALNPAAAAAQRYAAQQKRNVRFGDGAFERWQGGCDLGLTLRKKVRAGQAASSPNLLWRDEVPAP